MANGIELSLEKMVGETYKRVAEWHNDDGTAAGLKVASHEIVEKILELTFEQLNVKTKVGIKEEVAKEALEKINNIKEEKKETPTSEKKQKNGDDKILKKLF